MGGVPNLSWSSQGSRGEPAQGCLAPALSRSSQARRGELIFTHSGLSRTFLLHVRLCQTPVRKLLGLPKKARLLRNCLSLLSFPSQYHLADGHGRPLHSAKGNGSDALLKRPKWRRAPPPHGLRFRQVPTPGLPLSRPRRTLLPRPLGAAPAHSTPPPPVGVELPPSLGALPLGRWDGGRAARAAVSQRLRVLEASRKKARPRLHPTTFPRSR